MTKLRWLAAAASVAAAAWSADLLLAEPAPPAAGVPGGPDLLPAAPASPRDGLLELKWDNGRLRYRVCYYSGADTWVANDFDLGQFSDYRRITRIRLYSNAGWPNGRWDGFRVAVFSVSGGVPGSMIWGPKFVRPSAPASAWTWVNVSVAWTLPPEHDRFAVAMQQYYSYPNCDPHGVDDNATFAGHSWTYAGRWRPYANGTAYRNAMLRVTVSNNTTPVAPTSLGRVKALYH